jgi:hypothetical protein
MSSRSLVLSFFALVPMLATRSVGAADGSWDGGSVVLDATTDSEFLDVGGSGLDVPLGQPVADASTSALDTGADARVTADARLAVDANISADLNPDSPPAVDTGLEVASASDVAFPLDASSSVDGGARGVDGGVDSGPRPILLGDGAAKNLVPDDCGCSVGAFGAGRQSSGLLGLLLVGWAVLRSVRRRGRS